MASLTMIMSRPSQIACLMLIKHGLVRKTAKVHRIVWAGKYGHVKNDKKNL